MELVWCDGCQYKLERPKDGRCPLCSGRVVALPAPTGSGRSTLDEPRGDSVKSRKSTGRAHAVSVEHHDDDQLQDPIREVALIFKRWTIRCLLTAVVFSVCSAGLWTVVPELPVLYVPLLVATVAAWLVFLLILALTIWWRAFAPHQPTGAIYLRSFKNDTDTWAIRVAIQEALGNRLRLSGIRDPQRRRLTLSQRYSPIFIAMKYCTPRYMDLEAGDDWKRRLWNSLNAGQLAVVDLSNVTPFVFDEIQIATEALGMERVVFLGHAPQTKDDVLAIVRDKLGEQTASSAPHVVIWPGSPQRPASPADVQHFRGQIAAIVKGLESQPPRMQRVCPALHGPPQPISRRERQSTRMFWGIIKLQILLGALQFAAMILAAVFARDSQSHRVLQLVFFGPIAVVNAWLLLQNWLIYIYDVGVVRDRVKAGIGLAIVFLPVLFGLIAFVLPETKTSTRPVNSLAIEPLSGEPLERQLVEDRDDLAAERIPPRKDL